MRTLWIIVLALSASVASGQDTRTTCQRYGATVQCDSQSTQSTAASLPRPAVPDIAGAFERGREQARQAERERLYEQQLQLQNQLLQQQLQKPASAPKPHYATDPENQMYAEIAQLRRANAELFKLAMEAEGKRQQLQKALEQQPAPESVPKQNPPLPPGFVLDAAPGTHH